jgi:hypothetical protein
VTTTEKGAGIICHALALMRGGICWSNALETARVEGESGSAIGDRTVELMRSGVGWTEAIQIAQQEAEGGEEATVAGNDDPDCWVGM